MPSLRGSISGGGSAPPDEVVLKLMEANQSDWDPEADLSRAAESSWTRGAGLVEEVELGGVSRHFPGEHGGFELDDLIAFEGLLKETAEVGEGVEEKRTALAWVPVVQMYGGETMREHREGFLKQKAEAAWNALKLGRLSPGVLIDAPPFLLNTVTVASLYAAQPGWDVDRATRFLKDLSIDPATRIKDLSEEQRSRIAGARRSEPA